MTDSGTQRLLECFHHFCEHCLLQIRFQGDASPNIQCPVCCNVTDVPRGNTIAILPQYIPRANRDNIVNREAIDEYCAVHPNLLAVSYCNDCTSNYCLVCTRVYNDHDGHALEDIEVGDRSLQRVTSTTREIDTLSDKVMRLLFKCFIDYPIVFTCILVLTAIVLVWFIFLTVSAFDMH